MNAHEFKEWFEDYIEQIDESPTRRQWDVIQEHVEMLADDESNTCDDEVEVAIAALVGSYPSTPPLASDCSGTSSATIVSCDKDGNLIYKESMVSHVHGPSVYDPSVYDLTAAEVIDKYNK